MRLVAIRWKRKVQKTIELTKGVTEREGQRKKVGESSLKRPFRFKKCTVVIRRNQIHVHAPLGWAVLDCGAGKSLAGAGLAAMLAQLREKRRRKPETIARLRLWMRNTIFVGALGGQDAHYPNHHWWQHATSGWKGPHCFLVWWTEILSRGIKAKLMVRELKLRG